MSTDAGAQSKSKGKSIPDWAKAPFESYLDDIQRLGSVVRISARGIAMLRGAPRVLEVLQQVQTDDERGDQKAAEKRLAQAKEEAELASREVKDDFPVLHAWAIVAMWAQLEALIRTFLVVLIRHDGNAWACEEIQKLRIRLGDYEAIPSSARHLFIVELLEKELGTGFRNGTQHFEALLKPFGLSGAVPPDLSELIYELGQVRNLIAHNASVVDRKFKEACPWYKRKLGTKLHVSSRMFNTFSSACVAYVTLLIARVGEKFGVNMSETVKSVEARSQKLKKLHRRKRTKPR